MSSQAALGKRIRERRLVLSMTQDDLARRVGYTSRSSINKIELGYTDPPFSKLLAIADALDISPVALCFPDTLANDYTEKELSVISAYRRNPMAQPKVDKTLGIIDSTTRSFYTAAHSETATPDGFTIVEDSVAERLKSLPETDDTLM